MTKDKRTLKTVRKKDITIGVNFIMKNFDFYFGCFFRKLQLGKLTIFLNLLYSLSAAEGRDVATIVI